MLLPLMPKFIVPQVDLYDRSQNHIDHLENFKGHTTIHDYLKEVGCRAFPLTLNEQPKASLERLNLK